MLLCTEIGKESAIGSMIPSGDLCWNPFYSIFSVMTQRNEKVVTSPSEGIPLNSGSQVLP